MLIIKKTNKIIIILVLVLMIFTQRIETDAATTYTYNICFDYVLSQTKATDYTLLQQDSNVNKVYIPKPNGDIDNISLSLTSNKEKKINIIENNGYIPFTDFIININTTYETVIMKLYDEKNDLIYNSSNNSLSVQGLGNKKYCCEIKCTSQFYDEIKNVIVENTFLVKCTFIVDTVLPYGYIYDSNGRLSNNTDTNAEYIVFYGKDIDSGVNKVYLSYNLQPEIEYVSGTRLYVSGEYRFIVRDNAANSSEYYYTYIDHDKPKINIGNEFFFTDVYGELTIEMADESIAYLYCKKPNEIKYTKLKEKKFEINETMQQGKYYFYAVDIYRNKTDEYWINYCGSSDTIQIVKIENSNSVYLNWEDNITVKLNGNPYTKGTIISDEGDYTISFKDSSGNIIEQNFQILCYYKEIEVFQSTCTSEGYCMKECISCGEIKQEFYGLGNHKFETCFVLPKCETKGGLYHWCIYCDNSYTSDVIPPNGHEYNYEVYSATCYEDGKRIITCNNCSYYNEEEIKTTGHNKVKIDEYENEDEYIIVYMCSQCMEIIEEVEKLETSGIIKLVNFIKNTYFPYIVWILLSSTGVWSLVIGIRFIFLKKRNETVVTKSMIKNYILGLIAIFVLLIAIPLLIEGVASIL